MVWFRWSLLSLAVVVSTAGPALAERPRGTYIPIDESMADVRYVDDTVITPQGHGGSHILYLNRCRGGETFSPGFNDSRQNRSSIIDRSYTLPEYPYGDASFEQVATCVRQLMAPFNIQVVTEDPGQTPHHEAVVCGKPTDLGMQNGVGGVAPFSCGVIENSITYTFAEVYGGQTRFICETIAQEAAHGWGLDHEYLCEDPMTYLSGCGPKSYQDIDARCGEFSARNCQCGGATQNSFRRIAAVFGTADPTPPSVTITEPANNATVDPGFVVRADITDDQGIGSASLYVDDNLVLSLSEPPFVFNAPNDLADGDHKVEIVATDSFGAEARDSIFVIVGEPCSSASDCEDGEVCVDGRCVAGPGTPGGLGEACESGADCASGLCGSDSSGNKVCTEPCDPAANACPGGFECRSAGEAGGVCWPGAGGGGGGCGCTLGRAGDDTGGPLGLLGLIGAVGLALVRRRR
ncbi:MAG: hypothetical protein D6689_11190 [Deltaproteobacteria bacterium]|nr:MAG: hypothetical protein D6689_11190 [Deltaproteobacteria bacterium]